MCIMNPLIHNFAFLFPVFFTTRACAQLCNVTIFHFVDLCDRDQLDAHYPPGPARVFCFSDAFSVEGHGTVIVPMGCGCFVPSGAWACL